MQGPKPVPEGRNDAGVDSEAPVTSVQEEQALGSIEPGRRSTREKANVSVQQEQWRVRKGKKLEGQSRSKKDERDLNGMSPTVIAWIRRVITLTIELDVRRPTRQWEVKS